MHLFYPLRVTAFLSVVHSTLWIGTTRRSAPNNGLSIPLTLVKQILILHTVRKPTHTHTFIQTHTFQSILFLMEEVLFAQKFH